MRTVPPGLTSFRGQPGSCAQAQEQAERMSAKSPKKIFVHRITKLFCRRSMAIGWSFHVKGRAQHGTRHAHVVNELGLSIRPVVHAQIPISGQQNPPAADLATEEASDLVIFAC